ncbi:MAG TPA: Stp1/IreP family PP2C-type Ser/Thr phosphatase [Acidimicrobiia bacterium]|jgi:protein phosphatase
MRLVAGAATDVGRVRDGNEDAMRVDEHLHLYAVADGMGGHRAGEVASATALEALRAAVANGQPIEEAIENSNAAVYAKALDDPNLRGMGTTLTALLVTDDQLYLIGHVGDSRAYQLHDGELTQVTEDHSLVEELVREGRLTPEQATVHPQRSIITRALGVDEHVQVDVYPLELAPGDRVLICSDGLTTMLRADDIARILRREPDPTRAAEELVDAANAAGGEDNITAVVVEATAEDAPPDPATGEADVASDATTAVPPIGAGADAQIVDDRIPEPRPEPMPTPVRVVPKGTTKRVFRFVVWMLPVALVVGVAIGAVAWYARKAFYVTFDSDHVTLFRGRPGGVLGFDPTIEQRTRLRPQDLSEADRADVQAKKTFSDEGKAKTYIHALTAKAQERAAVAATTTTTAVPPPTTVPNKAPIGP